MSQKIALFGATGKTGKEFLLKALNAGYTVKALVRTPSKLGINNPALEIIKGDVLDKVSVDQTIKDTTIVMSLFGHVKGSPEWLQTNGTKNILASMEQYDVKKIISLSGGGLPFTEKDEPKFIDKTIRLIMKLTVPKILNDAIEHAKVLKSSDKKWIIVRGPRLTEGEEKSEYKVGWVGVNAGTTISRKDLANFMLKQVEDNRYIRQMPFVSY